MSNSRLSPISLESRHNAGLAAPRPALAAPLLSLTALLITPRLAIAAAILRATVLGLLRPWRLLRTRGFLPLLLLLPFLLLLLLAHLLQLPLLHLLLLLLAGLLLLLALLLCRRTLLRQYLHAFRPA